MYLLWLPVGTCLAGHWPQIMRINSRIAHYDSASVHCIIHPVIHYIIHWYSFEHVMSCWHSSKHKRGNSESKENSLDRDPIPMGEKFQILIQFLKEIKGWNRSNCRDDGKDTTFGVMAVVSCETG